MKTYKITIKQTNITLYKEHHSFNKREEAQLYSLGLCEGLRLAGMNPNRMVLKELKD